MFPGNRWPPVLILVSFLIAGCVSSGLRFKSIARGRDITFSGQLGKPAVDGPFPAVVILHGCAGVTEGAHQWARRLNSWGYVSFIIDSHSPRGIAGNCTRPKKVSTLVRAEDAYDAQAVLSKQPFVDGDRIGMIGFSEGGTTVLHAADPNILYRFAEGSVHRFKAAVSFYPLCYGQHNVDIPMMVLGGDADRENPIANCRALDRMPILSSA